MNASATAPQLGPRHQSAATAAASETATRAARTQLARGGRILTSLQPSARASRRSPARRSRAGALRPGPRSTPRPPARARPSERLPPRLVLEQADDGLRERLRVARRHRDAVSRLMTSRYPGMSDATAGVAHANARVSTIPKLSPPSDGATSAFVREQLLGELVLRRGSRARRFRSGRRPRRDEQQRDRERVGADEAQARARRAGAPPARPAGARAGPCAAPGGRRRRPVVAAARVGVRRDEHAVRDDLVVGRSVRGADSRACSETAMRWSSRSSRKPQRRACRAVQRSAPEAWKVADERHVATARRPRTAIGVIGSCRCSTSNRSRSKHLPQPEDRRAG